jgi:hypothetical protein
VAGFGVTKGFEGVSALPSVAAELAGIITTTPGDGGVLAGEIELDDQFTQQSMRQTCLSTIRWSTSPAISASSLATIRSRFC